MPGGSKKTVANAQAANNGGAGGGEKPIKGYKPAWIKEAAEPNKEHETPWGIMKKRDSINIEDTPGAANRKQRAPLNASSGGGGRRQDQNNDEEDVATAANSFQIPQLRKVSIKTPPENGTPNAGGGNEEAATTVPFVRPQLKSVKPKEPKPIIARDESKTKIALPKLNSVKVEKMKELPPPPKKETPDYRQVLKKVPTRDRIDEDKKKMAPMPPPMPPPAPAMPKLIKTDPLNEKQQALLDNLRSRPKTRPDWTALLKGIESGQKLKHVQCNDRSKPLLPGVKAKGQFLYESEKDNAHNVLLKEIQEGVKLKGVRTNDRSKPNLEGLRKFRRQMTIEEQIQKSVSMASVAQGCPPQEELPVEDELDDIDKVRDDLQSTKQLLTIEIKAKEQQVRENKRLQSRILNLEKELEEERSIAQNEHEHEKKREPDEKLIITLKAEAAEARKLNETHERKLTQTAKEMDNVRLELEEMKRRNSELEKRLQEYMTGKRHSVAQAGGGEDMDGRDEDDLASSESDEESEEKRAKRNARDLKLLVNKLRGVKNKIDVAKKERVALKQIVQQNQGNIKEEKKKFKQLQKEVDKMAKLMKDAGSDDEDGDDEDEEEQEDEEESSEEESSESETETSDSESERSQSEPEDAPVDKKKENIVARTRHHENCLAALKKSNFMLKANAERLQDDLNEQKEQTATLQADLDSVLADLG